VSFSILGPLEIGAPDGAPIRVSSPQQRTLLAALLTEPRAVVTTEALIDALWPENPPQAARNAVQVLVSKLRVLLEPGGRKDRTVERGLLVTRPQGYLIEVTAEQLDALRFERLIEAGRTALGDDLQRARGCLGDALALWRGSPLGELGAQPFARPWVAHVEELRLIALEGLVDARLAIGEHEEVVAELATLVAENPVRERLRAQQMVALYRCGRAPDALSVYRSARATMRDELGIEPGPELRALERAILRQDPELALRGDGEVKADDGVIAERDPEPSTFMCAIREQAPGSEGPSSPREWEAGLAVEERGGELLEVEEGRLLACFRDPASAAEAATMLASDQAVRAAVHTGHTVRVGDEHVGPAAARSARLAAMAHPGQVVLGRISAELVRGQLRDGLALSELGPHRLADLAPPETIYELTREGRAGSFPPLRSLEQAPNNLPVYHDTFIDRERDRAEIPQLLGRTRVVTLVGTGGSGKTRLAMQVAAEALPAFPDGVFVAELSAVNDERVLAGEVASAVGLAQNPRLPMLDVLIRHLADRRALIVLDTCEHLVGASAKLADRLTEACPGVRVLATSRERLRAPGELARDVPPLAVPSSSSPARDQRFGLGADSVRLLIERVSVERGALRVSAAEAEAAARICRRLAGLPLAIELAAARVPALGLAETADRLEAAGAEPETSVLRTERAGAPERHETMVMALDWSFGLLEEPERVLLRRLSVFAGPFTLDDAQAVAGGPELQPVGGANLLTRLVEKTMVVFDGANEAHVEYRLLDPVRDYAAIKLAGSGEEAELRRRHANWYLALAEQGAEGLHGTDRRRWLDRFETAHDNIRAALEWATESEEGELALRLAGAMWWFWYMRGHLGEGREWLTRVLELRSAPHGSARQEAVLASGHIGFWQGDFAHTMATYDELLDAPDPRVRAWTSMGLATIATLTGDDLDRAKALIEESVSLLRDLESEWELAYGVMTLGLVHHYRDEHERAAEAFEEAISIQRSLGQVTGLGTALRYRGLVAGVLGDFATAYGLCEESLALASRDGDPSAVAQALILLATVARYEDDLDRARPLYAEALGIAAEIGEILDVRWAFEGLAGVACRDEQHALAARLLAKAAQIGELTGYRLQPAEQSAHEADVESVRAALPARELEAAWAAGESMELDQAVEDALGLAAGDLVEPRA